jgi:DNA ligase (NAD+)
LEPVDVGGVTVEKVTLHNEGEVHKKDLRPGDRVKVIRAGDVIPEITERIKEKGKKRGKEFSMPEQCPSCGTEVVREGAYYFCPAHLNCPAQVKGEIVHFASREALNIEGLGEKTVETLVEAGTLKNIADIYTLTKDDLLSFEGFAEKSARQLIEEIQKKKQIPLDTFLYALGIHHVGEHMARVLASSYESLEEVMKKSKKELEKIDEIGPEIAESVSTFFERKENRDVIRDLQKAGVTVTDMPKKRTNRPLGGKTFVFTGALKDFSRKEAESAVEDLGGRAVSSVSGNTDYLILGEDPGSKLEEAKEEEDITILEEEDFKDLIS